MRSVSLAAAMALTLCACAAAPQKSAVEAPRSSAGRSIDAIKTIVVIYAENRAFDNLYGNFPGANGLQHLTPEQMQQRDRDGKILSALPPVPGKGLTDPTDPKEITTEATAGHPNQPFALDDPNGYGVGLDYKLHDLVHAFYQNQMQINGGKNDMFAAYSDAGGQVMGHFDGSKMALWQIAKKYTLADNFFQGGFGSSFFNHQYLICACAPFDFKTKAEPEKYKDNVSMVAADGVTLKTEGPPSALDGPPKFVRYGVLTPDYYAVNTIQPPYQPSGNLAAEHGDWRFADSELRNTLSPQVAPTIGDRLSDANIGWAWYGGGWKAAILANEALRKYLESKHSETYTWPEAVADGVTAAHVIFQYHHQPFNYYVNYAPGKPARAEHLRDGGVDGVKFLADIDAGKNCRR